MGKVVWWPAIGRQQNDNSSVRKRFLVLLFVELFKDSGASSVF